MGEFEGEELAHGNVARVGTLEEEDGDDSEEVGEDEVGREVQSRSMRRWGGGVEGRVGLGRRGYALAGSVLAVVDGDEDRAG